MANDSENFGFVIIGRNEGERLKRCMNSLSQGRPTVYVDSGSTDGSREWVKNLGIDVVELDTQLDFTAARARNAGFKRLMEIAPKLTYVQFLDGDCELAQDWPQQGTSWLEGHDNLVAVFGRRREKFPSRSIYNRLCDIEWDVPVGRSNAFGGDVMIRAKALEEVGGYRDDLIAGEEPELCVRLRSKGYQIWRLDAEMTLHDAAITRFSQWWQRQVRGGYAFAQGASLHGAAPERHWVKESRRALIWGVIAPVACCLASAIAPPWGLASWMIYPLQVSRLMFKGSRPFRERAMLALFHVMARIPEGQGYLRFRLYRWLNSQSRIIEYKR
jgi:cellulose synthase/poly-beta-1,6-N-acetylglucosamine synthase-like glycosyltransferase